MALKGLKGFCGVEIVYNNGFLFGQIAKFLSMQIIFCFNLRKSSWGGSKNSNLMLTLHSVWRKRKQKVSSCRSGTCRMSGVSRWRAYEKHFVVPLPSWEVTCHSGTPFSPIRAVLWRASNSRPGTQPAACARCLACPISPVSWLCCISNPSTHSCATNLLRAADLPPLPSPKKRHLPERPLSEKGCPPALYLCTSPRQHLPPTMNGAGTCSGPPMAGSTRPTTI